MILGFIVFPDFSGKILDGNTQPGTGNAAIFFQLSDNALGHVDGDGKSDTLTPCNNCGVDAHDLPRHVQKRSPAVARVDGGIGLNEIVIGTGADNTPLGADDTGGDGLLQTEGASNGHDPGTDLDGL